MAFDPAEYDILEPKSHALRVMQDYGYTPEQSAGIVGNLIHESNLNTGAVGDSGASFGIAQWNGDRLKGLENFAAAQGSDSRNFDTQLDYIHHELQTSESGAGQALRQAKDVESATKVFSEHFERPSKPMMESRLSHAKGLLGTIGDYLGPSSAEAGQFNPADYEIQAPFQKGTKGFNPGDYALPDKSWADSIGETARYWKDNIEVGWRNGYASPLYNTLANLPMLLNKLREAGGKDYGMPPDFRGMPGMEEAPAPPVPFGDTEQALRDTAQEVQYRGKPPVPGLKASSKDWLNWGESPGKEIRTDIGSQVIQGMAAAPGQIAMLTGPVKYFGPVGGFGALNAFQAIDKGVMPSIEAGIKGAVLGMGFKGMEPLIWHEQVLGLGALGALQAAIDGGGPKEITSGALTMMALGSMARGGSKTAREMLKDAWDQFKPKYEAAKEQAAILQGEEKLPPPIVQDQPLMPPEVSYQPVGKANLEGVHPQLLDGLAGLAQEYHERFGEKLNVVSGRRTTEHQAELYAAEQARNPGSKMVAQPGNSQHEPGEALDLDKGQAAKIPNEMLARYGLYRPHQGQGASGIVEPWHIERDLQGQNKPAPTETTASGALTTLGSETTMLTERGMVVQGRWGVFEADDLVTSHDTALNENPEFPRELQPRERGRAASQLQIGRIRTQLQPEFLGESPKASEGATIVGQDLIMESGNGRTIALKGAYDAAEPKAQEYRQWLLDNAGRFGLDGKQIEGMKKPVLVRVRQTEVDRPEFVRQANEAAVAGLSAVEQAKADAAKLAGGNILSRFIPNDRGLIVSRENQPFIRRFMEEIVGPNELSRYFTREGGISQEGINRVRNALFAAAYGDSASLEKLAESPDDLTRNVTGALTITAPRAASINQRIGKGELHDLSLGQNIADAAQILQGLRESGQPVDKYLAQQKLFTQDDPLTADLLKFFDAFKLSRVKIAEVLNRYYDLVEALGSPKQKGLLGPTEIPKPQDALQTAIERMETKHGKGKEALQADLFQGEPGGGEKATPAPGPQGTKRPAEAVNPPEQPQPYKLYSGGPETTPFFKKGIEGFSNTYREHFAEPTEPELVQWGKAKTDWVGKKNTWGFQAFLEAQAQKDLIRQYVGEKRYGPKSKALAEAIYFYNEYRINPEYVEKNYAKLPPEVQKAVDKFTLIESDPELMAIVDRIKARSDQMGKFALDEGVIKNLIENHGNRIYAPAPEQVGPPHQANTKFATKSRHRLERKFETVFEAMVEGNKKLLVRDATDNQMILGEELARVIADKQLLKENSSLFSSQGGADMAKINHPNFKSWEYYGNLNLGPIVEEARRFTKEPKREESLRTLLEMRGLDEAKVDEYVRRLRDKQDSPQALKDLQKEVKALVNEDTPGTGRFLRRDFVVDNATGDVLRRADLFAPKEIAKDINNILGQSQLLEWAPARLATKYGAIWKASTLSYSLFHPQAFIRNLATNPERFWNILSPRKYYQEGWNSIKEMSPRLELGYQQGLVPFKGAADWAELKAGDKTIFGELLNSHPATKFINEMYWAGIKKNVDFTFLKLGNAYKAQYFLDSLKYAERKNPGVPIEDLAKGVADYCNNVWGGLNEPLKGTNPVAIHAERLSLLARDWTRSNINLFVDAFGPGARGQLSRQYWLMALGKTFAATTILNLAMSLGDDLTAWERFRYAYEAGNLRILDADITPLYRFACDLTGKTPDDVRMYFRVGGHFYDVFKMIFDTGRFIHDKGSIIARMVMEHRSGRDWRGRVFTTIGELSGMTGTEEMEPLRGKLTKQGLGNEKAGVSWSQVPSYALNQAKQILPIPVQNLVSYLGGEMDGFEAAAKSTGTRVSSGRARSEAERVMSEYYRAHTPAGTPVE